MKKYYFLLVLLLSASLTVFALAEWNSYSIDTRVAAKFPSEPEEYDVLKAMADQGKTIPAGLTSRMFMATDETAIYQIMRFTNDDLNKISDQQRPSYFAGVLQGVTKSGNTTLLKHTIISTPAGDGLELQLRSRQPQTGQSFLLYSRMLLLDHVGYTLNFISRDPADSTGEKTHAQRQQFFNSLSVQKNAFHEH